MKAESIMIIKLVKKCCYGKKASSAMLSPDGIRARVVYCFYTGSLAGIGIDIPYTGTGQSVFRSVF